MPAADFPLHELGAVIHEPADISICHTGQLGILLGIVHHALGGVDMHHRGALFQSGYCGSAGIGKEVQDFHVVPAGLPDDLAGVVPVYSLLRK